MLRKSRTSFKIKNLVSRIVPFHFWLNVGVHLLLFSLGYLYCIILLNGLVIDDIAIRTFSRTIIPLLIIRMLLFFYHDLFQGLWRYVSFEDLTNIVRATVIGSLVFYLLGIVWTPLAVSESLYIMELVCCVMISGGVRYLVRNVREKYISARPGSEVKKIFLVGPIQVITLLLKEFMSDPKRLYRPVALIDSEQIDHTYAIRISDIPVLGIRQAIGRAKRFPGIHSVILCWPGATQKQLDGIVEELKVFQVPFKKIPQVEEILSGRVSVSDIREVGIEDLLERPPVETDMEEISGYLNNKTILVTGGGGSIGSEICRQVAGFNPKRLIVVERSENSLYDLQLEFKKNFGNVLFSGIISSVNDAAGMKKLMKGAGVDVVFHAAAYKHVPLMEDTPIESAYNNILGTYNVARAAMDAGVERFVMISTDKAVNPTNVMGTTKRIAEMTAQGLNPDARTRFMTVRFGNVLGSSGSVIPIFKKQILEGGPVTVTHAKIERFFMTIPEAVQLVLQAGCMGKGGEIFVLDMGKPVKILKLAEKLITLSGKRPYDDIEITFTGLRPGEKMYEELFSAGETHIETDHPRIKAAVSKRVDERYIIDSIAEISMIVADRNESALREKFLELVPGYSRQFEESYTPEPGRKNISAAIENISIRYGQPVPELSQKTP